MPAKKLRLWNGRAYVCRNSRDKRWSKIPSNCAGRACIAAYNRADAARLINEYTGCEGRSLDHEIKVYFAERWGNSMNGVTPERGLWISFDGEEVPVRVI